MAGPTSKPRLTELDGLRGLALLMILAFHSLSQEGVFPVGSFLAGLQRSVSLGWTALDLFFVLSGFLIGGILMDARSSPNYFKTFYARRFFRIVPVYYLWILLYIALIALAGDAVARLSNSGIRPPLNLRIFLHFLFLQNSFSYPLYGLAGSWFGHLWSLAVEEQFYLVAPLVVRLVPPRRLKWVLGGVVAAAILLRIAFRASGMPETALTTRTVCRMDALAIGMLAAIAARSDSFAGWIRGRKRAARLILAVLAAGVLLLWRFSYGSSTPGMQTVGFTWMALFYAGLLLLAVEDREGWLASALRNRVLRELGTVSYCVYLIHLVMNVGLHAVLLRAPPRISTAAGAGVTVLALVLTYVVAKASWLIVEGPLQRRGHAFKY